ncbi:MAG: DMT family transporter [Pseudonocardiaceae bacterium]|nr:MAG: DMT family transporter [Pseudonocardiaceae bacterium]
MHLPHAAQLPTLGAVNGTGNARGTAVAFVAVALAWGASFLFIKVGLQGLSPGQVVLARLTLGAVTLVAVMLVTRRRWPRGGRTWAHLLVVAIGYAVVPHMLFAWAEQEVPSSLASIYNATTPIMTLALTPLLLPSERLSRTQVAGLLTGLVGVVVLAAPWQLVSGHENTGSLVAQLACLGATASYGFAGLYLRRFVSPGGHDPVTVATLQIGLAALVAWALAPVAATGPMTLALPVVASMVCLGVLGTGFAYIWFNRVFRAWGPARASTVTYLSPVVGVALGVALLGEAVHWNEPLGGLVVVAGILASRARRDRAPTVAAVARAGVGSGPDRAG